MTKKYEFTLARDVCGRYVFLNYKDDDGNYKSTTPISKEDKIVMKKFMGLAKELKLHTLEAKIEIWKL